MSRSRHQRHSKFDILGYSKHWDTSLSYSENYMRCKGKEFVWRHRKIKPYGRKEHIGYGEETYSHKYGVEFMQCDVDKGAYRQRLKRELNDELYNNPTSYTEETE